MKFKFRETIKERSRRVNEMFANYEPIYDRNGIFHMELTPPPNIIWTVQGNFYL